jgi:hypothetical protein
MPRYGSASHLWRHGRKWAPEYVSWCNMKQRCFDENSTFYRDYGGRGITVCDRWLDFVNFFADMGNRPSTKHTIERINNDGNYEPSNCRWATRKEQANNRRSRRILELNGERKSLTEWATQLGIDKRRLHYRLNVLGWSVEKTITTPIRAHKPYERRAG